MFRRCVRDLTSVRSLARSHPRSQIPYVLSARNTFSTSSPTNPSPKVPPSGNEKKSGGGGGGGVSLRGLLLGGVLLGGGGALAYNYGYFDSFLKDAKSTVHDAVDNKNTNTNTNTQRVSDEKMDQFELKSEPNVEKSSQPETVTTETEQQETVIPEAELRPNVPSDESISTKKSVSEEVVMQDKPVVADVKPVQPETVTQGTESKDHEEIHVNKNTENGGEFKKNEQIADEPAEISRKVEEAGAFIPPEDTANQTQKDSVDTETQPPLKSLAELYSLEEDNLEEDTAKDNIESESANNVTSSGKYDERKVVVVDVVEAIRTAERQQAEADAYVFAEEKKRLKERYERELKDARALLVKKAEEVAMLERELNKEKAKAVATIKSVQEKAQQKLQEELQQKEEEARKQLERVQELAKAELAAAISLEKASQIEKIAEAELNINALCMAFYARSEEARQSHSVHNLALATLRMEDALSEGLPLRGEVESLLKSLEGIDKDTLLSLALSSLPKEALDIGTDTPMDLSIKFNALKGTLRRFSLIPANGGGLLTHAVARLASSLKIKEDDESGEGVESLITRVENLLINGKLAEAADALEMGSRGSQAEEAVTHWVRQVRARAIAEQTLSLLQSYASSITFS